MMCGFNPQSFSQSQIDAACVKIAKELVNAGANIYHSDNTGLTALHMAAIRGLTKLTRYLILQSKNISTTRLIDQQNGSQQQHQQQQQPLQPVHMEHEAYLNARDEDGRTALINAVSHGHLSTVKVLVKAGEFLLISKRFVVIFTLCLMSALLLLLLLLYLLLFRGQHDSR